MLLAHPEALELRDDGVTDGRIRAAVAADGSVVGFITVVPGDGFALELEDLFVDPDWVRQGVARSLTADVIATAKRAGSACVEVTANPTRRGSTAASDSSPCTHARRRSGLPCVCNS